MPLNNGARPEQEGETEAKAANRFIALDGLRGVAALLVVLLHVEWTNHLTNNKFVQRGYVSVDLFFILSGFIMSANYLDRIRSGANVRTFLGLRLFRLYPLHLTMLLAFLCLEFAKLFAQHVLAISPGPQAPFTGGNSLGSALANLLLLNGLPLLQGGGWNGPSWSISCEYAAYIVFSIVALSGLTRSRLFFIVGTVLAAATYSGLCLARGSLNVTEDWGLIRCLAGFFLGMLIFQWKKTNYVFPSGAMMGVLSTAVAAAALLTMVLTSGPFIALVIPFLAMMIALLQFDEGPVARLLASSSAQFLGRVSYSIYMVHSFIVVSMLIVLKRIVVLPSIVYSMRKNPIILINPWMGDVLVVVLLISVVSIASLTYVVIEEPGRLFGRRVLANAMKRSSTLVSS
jgi:peptidoglycan/LPS O-acetylase OafA/YrhL